MGGDSDRTGERLTRVDLARALLEGAFVHVYLDLNAITAAVYAQPRRYLGDVEVERVAKMLRDGFLTRRQQMFQAALYGLTENGRERLARVFEVKEGANHDERDAKSRAAGER